MKAEFEDQVVVVTGAAGGIGRAVVSAFARQGARVASLDSSTTSLAQMAHEGANLAAVTCDVTDESEVERAMREVVSLFGGVNILVNVAGVEQKRKLPVVEMPLEDWNRVLGVNLTGVMLCAKHAGRQMVKNGSGSIVNVASLAGTIARPNLSAYGVSKAALVHLTRIQAVEMAQHNVRVNAINPGATITPMLLRAFERDGIDGAAERALGNLSLFRPPIPMGRLAEPEELATAVCFLASARAGFVTGQVLGVDGGESVL